MEFDFSSLNHSFAERDDSVEESGSFAFAEPHPPPVGGGDDRQSHELFEFLSSDVGKDLVKVPSSTIEGSLLQYFNDPDSAPDLASVVEVMEKNPASSALIVRGRTAMNQDLAVIKIDGIRAEALAVQHKGGRETEWNNEMELLRMKEEHEEKVRLAEADLEAVNSKLERVQASRIHHEGEYQKQTRRARICHALKTLGDVLKDRAGTRFAGAKHSLEDIGALFRLNTAEDCGQLDSSQSLAVLHTLDVCGLATNAHFMQNWLLDPHDSFPGDRRDWINLYGRTPQVKTGRESKRVLNKRVAHYLGKGDPPVVATVAVGSQPLPEDIQLQFQEFLRQQRDGGDSVASASDNAGGNESAAAANSDTESPTGLESNNDGGN